MTNYERSNLLRKEFNLKHKWFIAKFTKYDDCKLVKVIYHAIREVPSQFVPVDINLLGMERSPG